MRQAQVAITKRQILIKDGRLQGLGLLNGLPFSQAMVGNPW
ncbi:hypothetical protein [Chlorogloea sp. CCALA 695]|nr:hypothetical protein [Chlorogloea sp. CCALA 695]